MIVLSKSRLHIKGSCLSCSYNEHNIDLSKLNEEKELSDSDNDLPLDSFRTIAPPPPPTYNKPISIPKPIPAINLQNIQKYK